jgi:hypothetical protein
MAIVIDHHDAMPLGLLELPQAIHDCFGRDVRLRRADRFRNLTWEILFLIYFRRLTDLDMDAAQQTQRAVAHEMLIIQLIAVSLDGSKLAAGRQIMTNASCNASSAKGSLRNNVQQIA